MISCFIIQSFMIESQERTVKGKGKKGAEGVEEGKGTEPGQKKDDRGQTG